MRLLAVIPARGGSKRIPFKNTKALGGKPLLSYTAEAALESGLFEEVVVSTDAEAVAEVARESGATVLNRPLALADDHSPASLVTLNALEQLNASYDYVCQLMPNCPFRNAEDIRASLNQLVKRGSQAQLSVTRYGWLNPWWAHTLKDGHLESLFPEALKSRSQDLADLYCPSGAVWWARPAALNAAGSFYTGDHAAFVLPWQRALDIDDMNDWHLAEALLQTAL